MNDLLTYRTLLISVVMMFAFVSTLMTAITLGNAVRLRHVRLTWKSGKLVGYPLFSSLFLIGFTILLIASIYKQTPIDMVLFLGYFWIGLNWFLSSFLSSKRYITDNGIVKNINDPSQTIFWHQIYDLFEKKSENKYHFTFLYRAKNSDKPSVKRVELTVPAISYDSFKKIMNQKLGRRFSTPHSIKTDQPSI